MTNLGYSNHPVTGDQTQPTHSNTSGAHIDANGNYNTMAGTLGPTPGGVDSSDPRPSGILSALPQLAAPVDEIKLPIKPLTSSTFNSGILAPTQSTVYVEGVPHRRAADGTLSKYVGY